MTFCRTINEIVKKTISHKQENEYLKSNINNLNDEIINLEDKISSQQEKIDQFNLDTAEVEFLKMNLYYSHKCRRSFFNTKGFSVGSPEYKKCVMDKGRKN